MFEIYFRDRLGSLLVDYKRERREREEARLLAWELYLLLFTEIYYGKNVLEGKSRVKIWLHIKFEMLWGIQVEMSVKSLNTGEPEFWGQFQATD